VAVGFFGGGDAESNQEEFGIRALTLEAQYARHVSSSHSQVMASAVVLVPGSADPGSALHDVELGTASALDDGHTDGGSWRNPVDRPVTAIGSHMENSVNNNGSPECYKGGRRGERSSPISEIYEGVRRRGQDAPSDYS